MGRPRKYHKHLPPRVYHRHGAFWFVQRDGKWLRLGPTLPDAYRALAALSGPQEAPQTVADAIARYRREVLPEKAVKTQEDQGLYLTRFGEVFGGYAVNAVRPVHIQQFVGQWSLKPTTGNRTLEVIKHLFQKAVQWGCIDRNPAREVERFKLKERTRYVTDEELGRLYALASPMMQCAIDLAVLTGLRRADLLSLTRDHLTDAGILIQTGKTGKALLIEWSDALRAVVAKAWAIEPRVRRHLIVGARGKPYTADGFSAQVQRIMLKLPKAQRFRWHDLRAKSASDDTLEAATARLGHTSPAMTKKHYYRAPQKVRPLR